MSLQQLVAHAGLGMQIPAVQHIRVNREIDSKSLWPRLVAHQDARGLHVSIERSDRRMYRATLLPGLSGMGMTEALQRYLASAGQPVAAGVIVVDGRVAAGRFYNGLSTQGIGVESLRQALGLRALHVIDEHTALRHAGGNLQDEKIDWVIVSQKALPTVDMPTVLCRMGTDVSEANLSNLGGSARAPHEALMRYPFAPLDDDEQGVVRFMRSRGLRPTFGNLLGSSGIAWAFEALSDLGDERPCPITAAAVVAMADADMFAQRACAVACGVIAQLCGLLSLGETRRVLLAGPAAGLLQPTLASYPIAARLRAVRGDTTDAPVELDLGVLATPIRYLDGARSALDEWLRELFHDESETVIERTRTLYPDLSPSQQRVADLVLSDPAFATSESISAIARTAGVSQPQVIRFCRTMGFRGLTDFKLTLVASLARSTEPGSPAHRAPLGRK